MDANGTRFHLLLGRGDWERCTDGSGRLLRSAWAPTGLSETAPLEWDAARNELALQRRVFQFRAAPADRPPSLDDRRGAARDRFGNWYWIDASRTEIRVGASGSPSSHFWSAADEAPPGREARFGDFAPAERIDVPDLVLGGLAVTTEHFLVAGVVDPGGLVVFDLLGGAGPVLWLWAREIPFRPFDLAASPGGGVLVLDRDNARYWQLDRRLLVHRLGAHTEAASPPGGGFAPAGGPASPPGAPPVTALTLDDSAPLEGDPIAIDAAPDGTVLVLERSSRQASRLRRYRDGVPVGGSVTTGDPGLELEVAGHDMALVPAAEPRQDGALGALYVVATGGNQVFEFALAAHGDTLEATLVRAYYPLRSFGGKAIVADTERAYYDFGDTWLPIVEQHRARYVTAGTAITPVLDGREPACVWHRVLIDACLPPDTSVRVWSRADDDRHRLAAAGWRREPDLLLRTGGTELPFSPGQKDSRYGTWELLVQSAHGRYLQLRLDLAGDGRSSPRVRSLRAYYPRFSYLESYLPAVYREDPTSASFLERFLANPEGMLTGIEDRIAAAQTLFDPRSAPGEALEWLAGWFDVALDPAWSEPRRRLFIRHAMDFFQWRGTVRGLELALRLALDECVDETLFDDSGAASAQARRVRVVEWFRRRTGRVRELESAAATGLRVLSPFGRWRPSHGADALSARFRLLVDPVSAVLPADFRFPVARPVDAGAAGVWATFAQGALGFVPSATEQAADAWREFLRRRYRRISALTAAYGSLVAGLERWDQLLLPESLPPDGAPLRDWYEFQSVILPMQDTAHRFTVLVPVRPPENMDDQEAAARNRGLAELARRIVELEKPAHTIFDVRFFWSVFRLGSARLGDDTIVEAGSRAAALRPVVLGHEHLGESLVAERRPHDLAARPAVGAARLTHDDRSAP